MTKLTRHQLDAILEAAACEYERRAQVATVRFAEEAFAQFAQRLRDIDPEYVEIEEN